MKTCEEWSLEFDLLYNNIVSDKAPGLEEYEKSVFLTRAQEAIVVALYKGTLGDAFESTEEVTDYLGTLVKTAECAEKETDQKLSDKSYVFRNPDDLLFRTWETATITTGCGDMIAPVVPVTQDEYWRTVRDPFKKQNERRVLRLSWSLNEDSFSNYQDKNDYSELVSDYPVTKYKLRYLSRPEPIILVDLEDGLTINGKNKKMTCKLDEALHQTILAEAVRMAKVTWNA